MNHINPNSMNPPIEIDQSTSSALVLRTLLSMRDDESLKNISFDRMIFSYLFLIRLSGLSLPQFQRIDSLVYGHNASLHMASFVSRAVKHGYLRKSATDSPGCNGKTYFITDKGIDKTVDILQKILKSFKESDEMTAPSNSTPTDHDYVALHSEDGPFMNKADKIIQLPLFSPDDLVPAVSPCDDMVENPSHQTRSAAFRHLSKITAPLLKAEHKLISHELKSRHTYEIYNLYIGFTLMPYSKDLKDLVYEKPFYCDYSRTKKRGDLYPDLSFRNTHMDIRYCIEIDLNSERASILFQKQLRYYKFMSFHYPENAADVFFGFDCPKQWKTNSILPSDIAKVLTSSRLSSMLFAIQVYQASSNQNHLLDMIEDLENATLVIHDNFMESHFQALMLLLKFVYAHVASDFSYVSEDIKNDSDHVKVSQLRAAILSLKQLAADPIKPSISQCSDQVITKQRCIFSYYLQDEHFYQLLKNQDSAFHPIWNGLSISAADLHELSDALPFYAPEFALLSDSYINRFFSFMNVDCNPLCKAFGISSTDLYRCVKVPFYENAKLFYELPVELRNFVFGTLGPKAPLHMRLGFYKENCFLFIENISADLAGLIRVLSLLEMREQLSSPVQLILLVRDSIYNAADLLRSYFPYEYGESHHSEYALFYALFKNAEEILANHPIHNLYEFSASKFLRITYIKQSCFAELYKS